MFFQKVLPGFRGFRPLYLAAASSLLLGFSAAAGAQSGSDAEIDELRRQIEELRAAVDEAKAEGSEARMDELERQLEVLAQELEAMRIGEAADVDAAGEWGLGVAASKVYRVDQGLSFGGYGEAVYQNFGSSRDDGAPSGKKDELDFLRAVLYVGYKFNDKWVFNSEIEFEHASTDKSGSASVEFAYIDYLAKESLNVRTGLVLIPLGWLNELHEAPLFFGANRPYSESVIIPSTWRESGAGLFGSVGPFSYRTYVVNGLDASGFSSSGLRGGRQKGSKALAEDFAWTGRLDYTGTPGLLVGASAYVGNSGQGLTDAMGTIDAKTEIFDVHAQWQWRALHVRGLWARATVDDVARLNMALGYTGSQSIGEKMSGSYLEVAYDVLAHRDGKAALWPFFRYETVDTQNGVPFGYAVDGSKDVEIQTFGVSFQPLDEVVFKFDVQDWSNTAGTGIDQWNLAVGYLF